jgi:hypothetical protein
MNGYPCKLCKHWTPTLGRTADDPLSTWGACGKLISINVAGEGPFIGLRVTPDVNANQPQAYTPRDFGCLGWEMHLERWNADNANCT